MQAEYILEHQCPQCGAGVNLSDTEHIFSCSYCKAKLVVVGNPYCSYFLKPSSKAPKDLIFIPYWRFKGIRWVLNARGIYHTLIDRSACASVFPSVPQTLGIRSQTVTMKFVQPVSDGIFLNAEIDCNTARTRLFPLLRNQAELARIFPRSKSPEISETADLPILTVFSGEVISLIYAPYYVCNQILYDGVSLSALGVLPSALAETADFRPKPPVFISSLCPACGWDCTAAPESQVLLCTKCDKAWIGRNSVLESLGIQVSRGFEPGDVQIPFWRFEVVGSQFPLATYADLVRLTNLPRAILPGMESQKMFFWIPAFKLNPELFIRLAKLMTVNQQQENHVMTIPDSDYYPVTLSAEEAFKVVSVVLGDIGPSRKTLLSQLRETSFDRASCTLVYIPFASKGGELVEKRLNFAVQSSALKWGRLL
jgi:hypothetical protein